MGFLLPWQGDRDMFILVKQRSPNGRGFLLPWQGDRDMFIVVVSWRYTGDILVLYW